MANSKLISIDKLFPPEQQAERKAFQDRFWAGEDIGRPIVIAHSWKTRYNRGRDPEERVRNFVACLEVESKVPWDLLPCYNCEIWPVSTASAFGGKIVQESDGGAPWIDPIIKRPEDVYELQVPPVLSGLIGEAVRNYEQAMERVEGYVPPRIPDMQGPLMTAGMLWKQDDFILAMYDHPVEVHHLLGLVTDYLISVYAYFLETFPDALMINWPICYLPHELGVGLVEDFMHLLSPDLYEEFGLPYVNRIADRFNGLLVHCCGVFKQHWDTVKRYHNLRGLDTQYAYSHPAEVQAAFPDVVHCMTLDYAERKRNFENGDPDAFLKFLIANTPRHVRWQMYGDADDLPGMQRKMDLVQATWSRRPA